MIAALFVAKGGSYFGLPNVDPWDETRDARKYDGPHAVVAHPPCERWGRYWYGGPMLHALGRRKKKGDDNGCFASALASVHRWGGVLEHPAASHAWRMFNLPNPPHRGGWVRFGQGWSCQIEQMKYGHRSRKATWLYGVGFDPPSLLWGQCPVGSGLRMDAGFHSSEDRRKKQKLGTVSRLPKAERAATPIAFRDVLIAMAESVGR